LELPVIVEIVGPAGVGKSSLTEHLCSTNPVFLKGRRLSVKTLRGATFLLGHGLGLAPIFLCCLGSDRWFSWYESKWLAYLDGWHRVLQQQVSNSARIIVVDQGPVFYLTTFHAFGPSMLRSERLEGWWREKFQHWSSVLDLVVWLDSPDEVLLDRIRSRSKEHSMKERPESEAVEFLARYRASFRQVLASLTSYGPLEILEIDTDRYRLDQIESLIVAKTSAI
jgi:hypothetical protein